MIRSPEVRNPRLRRLEKTLKQYKENTKTGQLEIFHPEVLVEIFFRYPKEKEVIYKAILDLILDKLLDTPSLLTVESRYSSLLSQEGKLLLSRTYIFQSKVS